MSNLAIKTQLKSIKPPKLNSLTKANLKAYFENTWALYETLFSSVKNPKTLYTSPDPLRNPLIFYVGHTAAFYINKFKLAGLITEGIDDRLDELFAVGVDPDAPENLAVSDFWPTIEVTRAYRQKAFDIVQTVIENADLSELPLTDQHPLWALIMTLEHDRIHLETSSMLIRQLNADLVQRPEGWVYAPTLGKPEPPKWIKMEGGMVKIGKSKTANLFGWDNEYGELETTVQPFQATKNLITNTDFLAFIRENGYETKAFWTNEGWDWKCKVNATHPKFWKKSGDIFLYRAMFDELSMPLDWPVEVNAHEALAYCAWKNDGSRLLTEAEFLLIARAEVSETYDPLFSEEHNLDLAFCSPTPVGYQIEGITPAGFSDIYGNVWDWLQDDFYPLPGFKTHPYYEDFSAPYMDKEHSMMAGGSWITTGTGASKYYRLWFRRHFFQHAGFRLAKSL